MQVRPACKKFPHRESFQTLLAKPQEGAPRQVTARAGDKPILSRKDARIAKKYIANSFTLRRKERKEIHHLLT